MEEAADLDADVSVSSVVEIEVVDVVDDLVGLEFVVFFVDSLEMLAFGLLELLSDAGLIGLNALLDVVPVHFGRIGLETDDFEVDVVVDPHGLDDVVEDFEVPGPGFGRHGAVDRAGEEAAVDEKAVVAGGVHETLAADVVGHVDEVDDLHGRPGDLDHAVVAVVAGEDEVGEDVHEVLLDDVEIEQFEDR